MVLKELFLLGSRDITGSAHQDDRDRVWFCYRNLALLKAKLFIKLIQKAI